LFKNAAQVEETKEEASVKEEEAVNEQGDSENVVGEN
jgi:hypothetical protein